MNKSVLITGGFGFLGRATALKFRQAGFHVVGIGHGRWPQEDAYANGFDMWLDAGVSLSNLLNLEDRFDLIVHCAGNGSVGFSLQNPLEDFHKTVQGTAELLEYMRLVKSNALLIYPSSAGVYGAKQDAPIKETDSPNPISPYGYHKKMVEDMLTSYSRTYGIRVAIIRFFSIYGAGLTKQLLWDASLKLQSSNGGVTEFWGTGEETRDWINSEDAAALIATVAGSSEQFTLINGASGRRVTVKETLNALSASLGIDNRIVFNGIVREGDPRFYHADISRARSLGWEPTICLRDGIEQYVDWLKVHQEHHHD
jgi:UDP-glucose 4-epimerase